MGFRLTLVLLLVTGEIIGCDGRAVYTPAAWIRIPAGTFMMGSPTTESCREAGDFRETRHEVTLTHAFQIADTETTQGQFEARMMRNPASDVACGSDCPVDAVTWDEAVSYCNALSKAAGLTVCYDCVGPCTTAKAFEGPKIYDCPGYRLPTEAEWEYAARAGTSSAFYSGPISRCDGYDANANTIGWYVANSGMILHQAKQKKANPWGLYDMAGSVWEWTHDWFALDLGADATTDPPGALHPTIGHMLRGGSAEVKPQFLRSASRWNYQSPQTRLKFQGFRCVRSVK